MCHRIRFTLKDAMPGDKLNGTVEADETYIGGRVRGRGRRYVRNKAAVVSLVERTGRVRSTVMDKVNGLVLGRLLRKHVAESSHLNTDESGVYSVPGKAFASHETVNHGAEEYVRYWKQKRHIQMKTRTVPVSELHMNAAEFDRVMRKAFQAPALVAAKKEKPAPSKKRKKQAN